MANKKVTYTEIIERLGEKAEQQLAWECGVHQATVGRWKEKGVPLEYWPLFIEEHKIAEAEEMYRAFRNLEEKE